MTHIRRPSALQVVAVHTDRASAGRVEAELAAFAMATAAWFDAERDAVRFETYCARRREAGRVRRLLRGAFAGWRPGERPRISLRRLAPQDWAESWKRHFRTMRVSERVVVAPTWARVRARPGDCVIRLDPGMSFGTGRHATTRHCLRMIDRVFRRHSPGRMLDAGCGSGILSIAAAKLGCTAVTGVDNDPAAVAIAGQNAALNGVTERCTFRTGTANGLRSRGGYDLVVANILADVLIACALPLARALAPGPAGRLILSGMMTSQYPAVRCVYRALGLREVMSLTDGEWTSGGFAWRGA